MSLATGDRSQRFVHRAADDDAVALQWRRTQQQERDLRRREGTVLAARHEDLERNNGFLAAMIESTVSGVLGARGLVFSSMLELPGADEPNADEAQREQRARATHAARRAIEREVARATQGTQFDAAGMWTLRDQMELVLRTAITNGIAIGIRVWKPGRGGRPYTGTCLRVLHPSRISNPDYRPDTDRLRSGWELDADGDPVAIHVVNTNERFHGQPPRWQRIPIWGTDGLRNVLVFQKPSHADQLVGWGWMRPILPLIRQLGETIDSYVVGRRMLSMFPIIISTSNRALLQRAASANRLVAPGLVMRPGEVYIHDENTKLTIPQWQFNGTDVKEFNDALMEVACAAFGSPKAVVMAQLNDANLAAARAALAAAYRFYLQIINRLAKYVAQPVIEWIVAEGLTRGRIDLAEGLDFDDLVAGEFAGPGMPTPDWLKDVKAAVSMVHELGISPETAFAMIGLDYEDEILRRAANEMLAKLNGVGLGAMGGADQKPADGADDQEQGGQQDAA